MLKERGFNVVLQDNQNVINNSSLLVSYRKRGIRYINVEAQKGQVEEQLELLKLTSELRYKKI